MTAASDDPDEPTTSSTRHAEMTKPDRLWTPWRMRYVAGSAKEDGCIFCNRLASDDDVSSLILHRGEHAFVIMNLFPYNTGHVMIVPNVHVSTPEHADPETLAELTSLRVHVLRALRRALSPEGFNLGLNVGAVAGAGVDDHLHEHVVPRWQGDANFMPILASTMVMPELIPVTYAKLRAELTREIHESNVVVSVVASSDGREILLDKQNRLPRAKVEGNEAVWRAGLRAARAAGANEIELAGWAGSLRADAEPIVLLYRAVLPVLDVGTGGAMTDPEGAGLAAPDREIVRAVFDRLRSMS